MNSMNSLNVMKCLMMVLCLSGITLAGCDREVESTPVRISQCDTDAGGSIQKCVALSTDTLTYALLNRSLGKCSAELTRPQDGQLEYRLKAGDRFYPSPTTYEDQFSLITDLRARLREGICEI